MMGKADGKEFYTAKEKLGLLSFGDPGAGDKVQVTDTYLVSMARRLDNRIKANPRLRSTLLKARSATRKAKGSGVKWKGTFSRAGLKKSEGAPVFDAGRIARLKFTEVTKPDVSIIIPAFNKIAMTTSCLESLMDCADSRVSAQVIVVDNGSSDETEALNKVPGLTYIYNQENLGFVGGCNSGIDHALGKYIVFLNNDTEVTKDWLYELFRTITNDPSVGLVGSKIVYPNGTLQEAGGIIFKDGSGLNYGKFDGADSYQYNYVREVDYCSGASIIISKKLLNEFDGFDTLYQPAYYEDTDLAFKVREAGLRVIYQPLSVLYHIEGGTAGTNLNSGFKKYQEINKEKFLKRWGKILKETACLPNQNYLGRDRSGDKLALIIEEALPTPDKDSGSVRMVAMIRALQDLGYKVTFWPNNQKQIQPYTQTLQQIGVEVVYGNIDFLLFAKHYAQFYDVVLMSRPEICARYINICRSLFANAKLVYDTVDLHYVRLLRQAEIEKANTEALLEQSKWYKILETGLMERTDATLVVSPIEVDILRNDGVNANLRILSNIHHLHPEAYRSGYEDRKDILFVGNYAHLPNRDAVLWLRNKILPEVIKKNTEIMLHIVGANMPEGLKKEVAGTNVVVHGFLSDKELAALLTKSRVFVAPLRYGAGVKGKIGQAIEYGLPVVATSVAAEGMYIKDGVSGLIADTAEGVASCIERLYDDVVLWGKIQTGARGIIDSHFSLKIATENLKQFLAD